MKALINKENAALPISNKLIELLTNVISSKHLNPAELSDITIIFRDDTYTPTSGGYLPVEVRLVIINEQLNIDYVTGFCYVGSGFNTELTKEIDFDFTNGVGFQLYSGHHKLADLSELFQLWQSNFIEYVKQDIFTISVTTS